MRAIHRGWEFFWWGVFILTDLVIVLMALNILLVLTGSRPCGCTAFWLRDIGLLRDGTSCFMRPVQCTHLTPGIALGMVLGVGVLLGTSWHFAERNRARVQQGRERLPS